MIQFNRLPITINADPKRVITDALFFPGSTRTKNIIERTLWLPEEDVKRILDKVYKNFAGRHRDIKGTFNKHFKIAARNFPMIHQFSDDRKQLIGANFTMEYSIQAAALFNPSMVPHPDQSGLKKNEKRFIISLRATGEGHISSIEFRTGIVDDKCNITLKEAGPFATKIPIDNNKRYDKEFVRQRIEYGGEVNESLLTELPTRFTKHDIEDILNSYDHHELKEIVDLNYDLKSDKRIRLSERVIFPIAKGERKGMEDVRFVKFCDQGEEVYLGTYTAYNGKRIRSQLIETKDFANFSIRAFYGSAINDKGMALFPEKIDGQYAIIGRHDGESLTIMFSDDLYHWKEYASLMKPKYDFECIQIGNNGSPIKTDMGWLLLTHAVGSMRRYTMSAALLDLENPEKVIGRLDYPIIEPLEEERDGYVPNVVYSCGSMLHEDILYIPFAMADTKIGFGYVKLNDLLHELMK